MKRVLCLILSITFLFSISACKKADESVNIGNDGGTSQQKVEKPLEFSIVNDAITWTKNNREINGSEELEAWNKFMNTKISFITPPHSDYDNKLNIMMASGDLPDVIVSQAAAQLVETENIIPLDDYIKKFGQPLLKKVKDEDFLKYKIAGKTYAIPVITMMSAKTNGFLFRKDWLDNLGLKEPETLDEYAEVMKAFTNNDPDKNGKKDNYGGTFRADFTWMGGFLGAFDIDNIDILNQRQDKISYDVVDGKLIPQQTQEKYREYLTYMRKLWEAKVFTPNSFINTSDQWKKEIFTGISGMWWHQNGRIDEYFMTQFEQTMGKNSVVKLVATKPPVGKNGKRGPTSPSSSDSGVFINKKAKEPERIFQYLVKVFTDPKVQEIGKYGLLEGKTYKVVDGKKQWLPDALVNDSQLQTKAIVFFDTGYPTDDDEVIAKYGQRAINVYNETAKFQRKPYEILSGKPMLQSEKDYPDQADKSKVLLEYTVKIISGEMPLEKFDEMVKRLKDSGLDKVTAERQEWYNKNKLGK